VSEIVEFCFHPKCHYRPGDPQPAWIYDPFSDEDLWPRLYCPACGKPRWLNIKARDFTDFGLVLDVSPRGIYIEPAGHFVSDGFRSQASDVDIFLIDRYGNPVAWLWDIRVWGENSMRQQFGLALPDACTFGPLTPCEHMVCAVCGNQNWAEAQLTPVATRPGDIVWVCRHGHFQGENVDPYTGMVWHMTGPKTLEVLEWVPELVVPKLHDRWWGPWRLSCET